MFCLQMHPIFGVAEQAYGIDNGLRSIWCRMMISTLFTSLLSWDPGTPEAVSDTKGVFSDPKNPRLTNLVYFPYYLLSYKEIHL